MKLQKLRKKLIVESAIAFGVIAVLGGVYFGVSSWVTSKAGSSTEIENRASQQQSEIATLRSKIEGAGTAQKTYASIVENRGNERFMIDNDQVRDVLLELVRRYRLNINGKLEYSAEKPLTQQELVNLTSDFMLRKDARLKFNAISDMHAYAFLQALQKELPGVVQITEFRVTKQANLTREVLSSLSLGKEAYLVDAEVAFDWYSIAPKKAAAADTATVGAPAPTPPGAM